MSNPLKIIASLFQQWKNKLFQREKPYLRNSIIAAAVIASVFITIGVLSAPAVIWIATTSTNCLEQQDGSTIVHLNDDIYMLGTQPGSFQPRFARYETDGLSGGDGDCDPVYLADPPFLSGGATLLARDSNTIYAYLGQETANDYAIFEYNIAANSWYRYKESLADDSANAPALSTPSSSGLGSQNSGNSIVAVGNEIFYLEGFSWNFGKYRISTNDWVQLTDTSGTHAGSDITAVGTTVYALPGQGQTAFQSFDTTQPDPGSWTTLTSPPEQVESGGALTTVGTDLYVFRGANTKKFWKYDTLTDTWDTSRADAPDFVHGGGALFYPETGDFIYAFQGNNMKNFWRYSISGNTWSSLADTPKPVSNGGDLAGDADNIYAVRGGLYRDFWRYNIANDRWNNIADAAVPPPTPTEVGQFEAVTNAPRGGITYIASGPSGGPEIYLSSGNAGTNDDDKNMLYRFALTGANANTWVVKSLPGPQPSEMAGGASLAYPGVSAEDPNGDNLFVLQGSGSSLFWKILLPYQEWIPWNRAKIDVNGDPDTPLSQEIPGIFPAETPQNSGNTITEVNGKFYVYMGVTNPYNIFIAFDPSTNTWEKLADLPTSLSGGNHAFASPDNNTIYALVDTTSSILNGEQTEMASFFRYDIPTDRWFYENVAKLSSGDPVAKAPTSLSNSFSDIIGVAGNLYIASSDFFRYNPIDNTWLKLNKAGNISDMVAVGTNIYGSYNGDFYIFDTTTDQWTGLTDIPVSVSSSGHDLAYHPGTNTIYASAVYGPGMSTSYPAMGFYEYDIGTDTWSQATDTPKVVDGGGSLTYLSATPDFIYATSGGINDSFWRYCVENTGSGCTPGTWETLANTPEPQETGSSLASDGTSIFATRGGGRQDFWEYNEGTNTWSIVAEAPIQVGETCDIQPTSRNCGDERGGITFVNTGGNDEIWMIPGFGFNVDIFRYDIGTNSWPIIEKPAYAPREPGAGASLIYPGSGNFLYAFKGAIGSFGIFDLNEGEHRHFWLYDFTNNTWRATYQAALDSGAELSRGSRSVEYISSEGSEVETYFQQHGEGSTMVEANGDLYFIAGDAGIVGNNRTFHRYSPTTDTWTRLADQPDQWLDNGAALTQYDANTLYLHSGVADMFMKYDIPSDTWIPFNKALLESGDIMSQPTGEIEGNFTNVVQTNGKFYAAGDGGFYEFDPATNEWSRLQPQPAGFYSGSMVALDSDNIIAIGNFSSERAYRYTISENRWRQMTATGNFPSNGFGNAAAYPGSGSDIYYMPGNNSTNFGRITITGLDTFDYTPLATTPAAVYNGGSLAIIGNDIFATRGNGSTDFWRYDITGNSWNVEDNTPSLIFGGGTLETDGTYAYLTQGGQLQSFWRFDPTQASGSRWSDVGDPPVDVGGSNVSYSQYQITSGGADLVFWDVDGTPSNGDEELWLAPGNAREGTNMTDGYPNSGGALYRYKITTDEWPQIEAPMQAPSGFGTTTRGGGIYYPGVGDDIFTLVGGNSAFYSYNVVTDEWFDESLNGVINDATSETISNKASTEGDGNTVIEVNNIIYMLSGYNFTNVDWNFFSYDPLQNEWTPLSSMPPRSGTSGTSFNNGNIGEGASLVRYDNDTIYGIQGDNQSNFWKYTISKDAWEEMQFAPATFSFGSSLGYPGGDFIYAFRGSNTTTFYSYCIQDTGSGCTPNTWNTITAFPGGTVREGGSLLGLNGSIYAFRGNNTNTFYRFDPNGNPNANGDGVWTALTGPTGWQVDGGAELTHDGTDIYAVQGGASNLVSMYTVGTDTWSSLANHPINIGGSLDEQGGIVYLSTGPSGGAELFATPGNGGGILGSINTPYAVLFRYPFTGPNANTWPTVAGPTDTPSSNGAGADIIYPGSGDLLYAFRGTNTNTFWAYNMVTKVWTTPANLPVNVQAGGSLTTDGVDSIYATPGNGSSNIYRYCFTTGPNCGVANVWSLLTSTAPPMGSPSTARTLGGLEYLPIGDSGGAELIAMTGYGRGSESVVGDSVTHPGSGLIFRYPFTGPNANTWPLTQAPPPKPPTDIGTGADMTGVPGVNGGIYALRGGNLNDFWKYTITNTPYLGDGTWNTLTSPSWGGNVYGGGSLANDGSGTALWALRGNGSPDFARYDITGPLTGTWTNVSDMPVNMGPTTVSQDGGGMVFYDNKMWVSTSRGVTDYLASTTDYTGLLYNYIISNDEWPVYYEAGDLPSTVGFSDGSDIVSTPNGLSIYAIRGLFNVATSGASNFWRYDVSGSGPGIWTEMTNLPNDTSPIDLRFGSSIAAVTDTLLYILRGNQTKEFYSFDATQAPGSEWTAQTDIPENTASTTDSGEITYVPTKGSIYAVPANDGSTVYRFPINKLAITNIEKTGGGNPEAGESIDVTVQSQDPDGNAFNIPFGQPVDVEIAIDTGSGNLSGTITGQIAGDGVSNTIVISGAIYDTPDSGVVLQATDVTSPTNPIILSTGFSAPFNVDGTPINITSLSRTSGTTSGSNAVTVNGTGFVRHFYQDITVNNPGGALTNVIIPVSVNTLSLINNDKMRNDCNDIRMMDALPLKPYTSTSQLAFSIDNCNSLETTINVFFSSLPNGNTTIYLGYGDFTLASADDPSIFIVLEDDFTGAVIDGAKWVELDSGTNVTQNDALFLTPWTSAANNGIYSITDFDRNYVLEFDITQTNTSSGDLLAGWKNNTTGLAPAHLNLANLQFSHAININGFSSDDAYEDGSNQGSSGQSWTLNVPYRIRITPKTTNGSLYERSTDGGLSYTTWRDTTLSTDDPLKVAFAMQQFSGGSTAVIDNVVVLQTANTTTTATIGTETPILGVTYDSIAAFIVDVAASAIQTITPPHAAGGPFDVVVDNADNQSDTLPGAFTFNLPVISNINPNVGSVDGGTFVSITGTDFTADHYVREISINNTAGAALTDYQISFTLDTQSLINAGKMRPDGGDIRIFADAALTTPINNFWIDGPLNATQTKIWVKMPAIGAATTETIYLVHGDLSLTTPGTATIANTFEDVIDGLAIGPNRGEWSMNESSGTSTVADGSVLEANGTMQGTNATTNVIAGKYGNARNFDGTSNYISVPDNQSFDMATELSIEAWVRPDNISGNRSILGRVQGSCGSNSSIGYDFYVDSSERPRFYIANGSDSDLILPSQALSTSTLSHLVGTYNQTTNTGIIYRNNSILTTDAAMDPNLLADASVDLRIGDTSGLCNQFWQGDIDEVRIYNKALSGAEISTLYNNIGVSSAQAPGQVLIRKRTNVNDTNPPIISVGTEQADTSVTFDAIDATIISVAEGLVELATPAHIAGAVTVLLTNKDSATDSTSYTYGAVSTDAGTSSVDATPAIDVEADGVDISLVEVTLRDSSNNPAPDKVVTLADISGTGPIISTAITCPTLPGPPPPVVAPGTTDVNGRACFNVTTSPVSTAATAGTYEIQATDTTDVVVITDTATIDFIDLITDKTPSTFTAPGGDVAADGIDVKTATVTLLNKNSVAIPSRQVTGAQTSGSGVANITNNPGTTNASGQATFDISTTIIDLFTFEVTDTGAAPNVTLDDPADEVSVNFVAGPTDPNTSTIIAVPDTGLLANGIEETDITVTLVDGGGNPNIGDQVVVTDISALASNIVVVNDITDANGQAFFTATATASGVHTFEAENTTLTITLNNTEDVTFTGPTAAASTVTANPTTLPANNLSPSRITVTSLDAAANVYQGQSITLAQIAGTGFTTIDAVDCTTGTSLFTGANATTDTNGEACYNVTSASPSTFTFQATNNSESFVITQTVQVTFSEGLAWNAPDGIAIADALEDPGEEAQYPKVIRTTTGDYIAAWMDERDSTFGSVFAQKYNSSMVPQWTPTGIEIFDGSGLTSNLGNNFDIVSDNAGGAIITWAGYDGASRNLRGQRLDSSGTKLWNPPNDSLLVNNIQSGIASDIVYEMIEDGAGGVFIAYKDADNSNLGSLTRINSSGSTFSGGTISWPTTITNANDFCSGGNETSLLLVAPGIVRAASILPSASCIGGSTNYPVNISTFNDTGVGTYTLKSSNLDTSAAVDRSGVLSAQRCTSTPYRQTQVKMINDGTDGIYVAFLENCNRVATSDDDAMYMNHIPLASSGESIWSQQLVEVGATSFGLNGAYNEISMESDGTGNAVVLWRHNSSSPAGPANDGELHADKVVNNAGAPQLPWNSTNPLDIAGAGDITGYQVVAGGPLGGANLIWSDGLGTFNERVYGIQLTSSGTANTGWNSTGNRISDYPHILANDYTTNDADVLASYGSTRFGSPAGQPRAAIDDGAEGLVIVWHKTFASSSASKEAFIQRMSNTGAKLSSSGNEVPFKGTAERTQTNHKMIRTLDNDIVVAWEDDKTNMFKIFAEKFDLAANILWNTTQPGIGFPTCYPNAYCNEADSLSIDADWSNSSTLTGGMVSMYRTQDGANDQIEVSKLSNTPIPTPLIKTVDTTASTIDQNQTSIVSDRASGAMLAWVINGDIYGMRVDSNLDNFGAWNGGNAVNLTNGGGTTTYANPRLFYNGTGGNLFLIAERTTVATSAVDIVAFRYAISNGVLGLFKTLTSGGDDHFLGDAFIDASNNLYVTWHDDGDDHIYSQKLDSTLTEQWTIGGVEVSSGTNDTNPVITSDQADGALIAWESRNGDPGTASDIVIRRINSTGSAAWNETVITNPADTVFKLNPAIASDEATPSGGALIAWEVWNAGGTVKNIYNAHIVGSITQNTQYGDAITSSGPINTNPLILSDGNDSGIVTWQKEVNGLPDIYGQYNVQINHAYNSNFTSSQSTVTPNGVDFSLLTATMLDQGNNPIVGDIVQVDTISGSTTGLTLTAIDCGFGATPGTTDVNGQACFEVSATTAGIRTFVATDTSLGITIPQEQTITFEINYCTPIGAGNCCGIGTTNFTLDSAPNINNPSSVDPIDDYQDFTYPGGADGEVPLGGPAVSLEKGGTYNVTFTKGDSFGTDGRLWIDYNQNGDFTDPGEEVSTLNDSLLGTGPYTMPNFVIPGSATNGPTRMRIGTNYYLSSPPVLSCSGPNYSEWEDYTVDIQPSTVSVSNSTFAAVPTNIPADNIATSTLTVTVLSQSSLPMAGENITIDVPGGGGIPGNITVIPNPTTPQPTDINGQVTYTVQSSVAQAQAFEATVNGTDIITQQPTVTFEAVNAGQSSFSANPTSVAADGIETSTLTATTRTANGDIFQGANVTAAQVGGSSSIVPVAVTCASGGTAGISNAIGEACFEVDTPTAEVADFEATANSVAITQQAQVTFYGPPDSGNSTVVANPASVIANGVATSTITVTLHDSLNNPVPGRTVEISDDQLAGQIDYIGEATPPPYPNDVTDAAGEVTFDVASTSTDIVTFTATDITGAPAIMGSDQVEFTCVLNSSQQCVQINIDPSVGVLTITAPDDFSFPDVQSAISTIESFSLNSLTPYTLNTNDVVTVTDTQMNGGFTLQLQSSVFADPALCDPVGPACKQIPLSGVYAVTQASSTGGTQISGVEYDNGYAGVTNITATQDNATAGSLTDATTFTTHGDNLDTIIDLMIAPVTIAEVGRNGQFKENVQYLLQVPAFQELGSYQVTLTFDLTRTAQI